eukprot:218335_1
MSVYFLFSSAIFDTIAMCSKLTFVALCFIILYFFYINSQSIFYHLMKYLNEIFIESIEDLFATEKFRISNIKLDRINEHNIMDHLPILLISIVENNHFNKNYNNHTQNLIDLLFWNLSHATDTTCTNCTEDTDDIKLHKLHCYLAYLMMFRSQYVCNSTKISMGRKPIFARNLQIKDIKMKGREHFKLSFQYFVNDTTSIDWYDRILCHMWFMFAKLLSNDGKDGKKYYFKALLSESKSTWFTIYCLIALSSNCYVHKEYSVGKTLLKNAEKISKKYSILIPFTKSTEYKLQEFKMKLKSMRCNNSLCKKIKQKGRLKTCKKCMKAMYCSRKCQKIAWIKHRHVCDRTWVEMLQSEYVK